MRRRERWRGGIAVAAGAAAPWPLDGSSSDAVAARAVRGRCSGALWRGRQSSCTVDERREKTKLRTNMRQEALKTSYEVKRFRRRALG